MDDPSQIVQAALLARESPSYFPQILSSVLDVALVRANNNELSSKVLLACVSFIHSAFVTNKFDINLRKSNSHLLLPLLEKLLINDKPSISTLIVQKSLEIYYSIYNFIFNYLINNPLKEIWNKLSNLNNYLIDKLYTSYPLNPLNKHNDLNRSIGCKLAILKLIHSIILTQLPNNNSIIPSNHPFLYNSSINNQAHSLIDFLFNYINNPIIHSTLIFSTILSILMSLFKLKSQLISNKLLNFILSYESQFKFSNYFNKLLKNILLSKFNDRLDKILLSLLLNRGFIDKDLPLKSRFSKKLSYMIDESIKYKKNLLDYKDNLKEDPNHPIFFNESSIPLNLNYKSLFSLIDPNYDNKDDNTNSLNVSSLDPNLRNNLIIESLKNVSNDDLNYALSIIINRCFNYKNQLPEENKETDNQVNNNNNNNYNTIQEQQQIQEQSQIQNIIKSSSSSSPAPIHESNSPVIIHSPSPPPQSFELPTPSILKDSDKELQINHLLSSPNEISINYIIRLITRGININTIYSNKLRELLFNYFKENDLKQNIDNIIIWLNEEYYSSFIVNKTDINNYLIYTNKIIDSILPFIENNDRNLIIRLLSELPYLNDEIILKLKSLCMDPLRNKMIFQVILYLIMFKPPVLNSCLNLIKLVKQDALNVNDENLSNQCDNYLSKYSK